MAVAGGCTCQGFRRREAGQDRHLAEHGVGISGNGFALRVRLVCGQARGPWPNSYDPSDRSSRYHCIRMRAPCSPRSFGGRELKITIDRGRNAGLRRPSSSNNSPVCSKNVQVGGHAVRRTTARPDRPRHFHSGANRKEKGPRNVTVPEALLCRLTISRISLPRITVKVLEAPFRRAGFLCLKRQRHGSHHPTTPFGRRTLSLAMWRDRWLRPHDRLRKWSTNGRSSARFAWRGHA